MLWGSHGGLRCAGLYRIDYSANRLAVALTQEANLGQLFLAQILVSVGDVPHGIIQPILLVLRQGIDDPAAEDVTEQLVTSLGKRDCLRGIPRISSWSCTILGQQSTDHSLDYLKHNPLHHLVQRGGSSVIPVEVLSFRGTLTATPDSSRPIIFIGRKYANLTEGWAAFEVAMAEHEEIYGKERADRLAALLRALAARIQELDQAGQLLGGGPELLRMMGDARSELFHYEVRSTYDTPEVADSRRIVEEAQRQDSFLPDEPEDDEPWRRRRPE